MSEIHQLKPPHIPNACGSILRTPFYEGKNRHGGSHWLGTAKLDIDPKLWLSSEPVTLIKALGIPSLPGHLYIESDGIFDLECKEIFLCVKMLERSVYGMDSWFVHKESQCCRVFVPSTPGYGMVQVEDSPRSCY